MGATRITPFFLLIILLTSCGSDPLDVDTSSITVDPVKVNRLDKDFFSLDTAHLDQGIAAIRQKYGIITDCFLNNVICYSARDSQDCYMALNDFVTDHSMRGAWEDCDKQFVSIITI